MIIIIIIIDAEALVVSVQRTTITTADRHSDRTAPAGARVCTR